MSEESQWRRGASEKQLRNLERIVLKFSKRKGKLSVEKRLGALPQEARKRGPKPAPAQLIKILERIRKLE